jgi:hypothetical protein
MSAPGLDKLHDAWQPAPVSWMPQTPAWYVLFALAACLAAWIAFRTWRRWQANEYRRSALAELDNCEAQDVNLLLKRCALSAWPRERVARLSGGEWLEFLDASYAGKGFTKGPGRVLADLGYRPPRAAPDNLQALRQLAREWIRRHRVRA